MLDGLLGNLHLYVQTNPWLAVAAAFLGGLLTASNPCVLVMIPLMVGFVAGRDEQGLGPGRAFVYSAVFVLGLGLTFVGLGVTAALAGSLYGDVSSKWRWIVSAVCIVMGLHLTGVLRFRIPAPIRSHPQTRGVAGALAMGLLFGFVSAPCAGPILIVLLTYIAGAKASVSYGALLLLVYSLGHSVLVLVAGTSMGAAKRLLESNRITRATELTRQAAGGLIVLVGLYFAWAGFE